MLMVLLRFPPMFGLCVVLLFSGRIANAQEPKTASLNSQSTQWIQTWIDANLSTLVEDYWWFHENPELSYQEEETAKYIAAAWKKAGFDGVTEAIATLALYERW